MSPPRTKGEIRSELTKLGADLNMLDSVETYISSNGIANIDSKFVTRFAPLVASMVEEFEISIPKKELAIVYPKLMEAFETF